MNDESKHKDVGLCVTALGVKKTTRSSLNVQLHGPKQMSPKNLQGTLLLSG